MTIRRIVSALFVVAWLLQLGSTSAVAAESAVQRMRRVGLVRCGVDATPGFHVIDANGAPVGFEADLCRALAAATLGRADAIETVRVATAQKFTALARADIDVAFGQTTWTLTRDVSMGVAFPAWHLIDSQAVLAWADAGMARLEDTAGRGLCVQGGGTSEANVREALAARKIAARLVLASTTEERTARFLQRDCEAMTGDRFELAGQRAAAPGGRTRFAFLPEALSREPLGPVVAAGDKEWFDIVRWTLAALVAAEYRGISQGVAADAAAAVSDPEARRLLGLDGDLGPKLGLDRQWARRAITAVGHYGEIFDRHLGVNSALGLERGQNALWTQGGLLFAPPLR